MKKFIVIGASAASIAFISKLRSFDKEAEIICFSGEATLPYNRCFLADFLTDDTTEIDLQLKPQDFFDINRVDLRLSCWVEKIDVGAKKVFASGSWHVYDYLFLGMGTKPVVPKFMQNVKASGLFNFHTLSDMQNIKKFIAELQPKRAIVVGAGLNGIEAASSLAHFGLRVTIVEGSNSILAGQVDGEIAQWLSEIMLNRSVRVIASKRVTEIGQKNNTVNFVILDDGSKVETDMIVVAAGSCVNSDLLIDTEIRLCDRSVIVDRHLKTNIEGILAGGDLCLVPDMLTGDMIRSTTWSDAMLQGLCAATNFSPTARVYPGMLGLRDSCFFGKDFYACGRTIGHADGVQAVTKRDDQSFSKFYIMNEQLIGFVLIGDISRLSELKMWYASRKKIKTLDL